MKNDDTFFFASSLIRARKCRTVDWSDRNGISRSCLTFLPFLAANQSGRKYAEWPRADCSARSFVRDKRARKVPESGINAAGRRSFHSVSVGNVPGKRSPCLFPFLHRPHLMSRPSRKTRFCSHGHEQTYLFITQSYAYYRCSNPVLLTITPLRFRLVPRRVHNSFLTTVPTLEKSLKRYIELRFNQVSTAAKCSVARARDAKS